MNGKIASLLDKVSVKLGEGLVIARHMIAGINSDITEMASLGEEKLKDLIDRTIDQKEIRKMARAFFKNISRGKGKAAKALRAEYAKYQDKLDKLADDKKEIVGFWDGFVNIFLMTPTDRKASSRVYTSHVRYGKVIGVVTALFFLLPAGGIRTLFGSLPVAVRCAEYFQRKVMEAKKKAAKDSRKT